VSPTGSGAPWLRTVRVRLTLLYSALVVGSTAAAAAAVELLASAGGSTGVAAPRLPMGVGEPTTGAGGAGAVGDAATESAQRLVDTQSVALSQRYVGWLLVAVLAASLLAGWVLLGRALRPLARMSSAAAAVSRTDLSRRIGLTGRDDEFGRLADRLDAMLDRLEDAFRAQRRLMEDASHELRNPLAVIRSHTEAVLLAPDTTPAERREAAVTIERSAGRMTRLVDDLLAAARHDPGQPGSARVDATRLVQETAAEHRTIAAARGVRVAVRLPGVDGTGTAGLTVDGDADALRRALANLVDNALRFAPRGSTVTMAAGRAADWCWLAVADAGPGIPAGADDRVFERRWRVEQPLPDRAGTGESGSGLGLAIVRQIARAHRGAVRVHGGTGGGAVFVLWLPAASTAA
jgi:signal transduction histidine kinase